MANGGAVFPYEDDVPAVARDGRKNELLKFRARAPPHRRCCGGAAAQGWRQHGPTVGCCWQRRYVAFAPACLTARSSGRTRVVCPTHNRCESKQTHPINWVRIQLHPSPPPLSFSASLS